MSVEYYIRLERGNATGVSEAVLEGIGRALVRADHRAFGHRQSGDGVVLPGAHRRSR